MLLPVLENFKAKLCRLEKLRHRLDSCWKAYEKERNKYYAIFKCRDRVPQGKVEKYRSDPHKLYQLVCNLTSKSATQQWLEHTNKEDLENDFEQKILTIREKLVNIPHFKPEVDSPL